MTIEEVKSLMGGSRNEGDWNTNCGVVKAACGGYPDFWFREIIASGLMNDTLGPGSDEIHIVTGRAPASVVGAAHRPAAMPED